MMKDKYVVLRIKQNNDTDHLILDIHYAKRKPSISYIYGLYLDGDIVGCISYGTPPSSPLRKGLAGNENAGKVLELNRLVLKNNLKNEASLLIGQSLKLLKSDFGECYVVSFADTEQEHIGTVYKATNFIYCGLSAKRTDWKIRGREHLHGYTVADEFRGVENRAAAMREKYGDDFYLKDRPRKHRYIYVVCSKTRRKNMINSIKYKVEEFPFI